MSRVCSNINLCKYVSDRGPVQDRWLISRSCVYFLSSGNRIWFHHSKENNNFNLVAKYYDAVPLFETMAFKRLNIWTWCIRSSIPNSNEYDTINVYRLLWKQFLLRHHYTHCQYYHHHHHHYHHQQIYTKNVFLFVSTKWHTNTEIHQAEALSSISNDPLPKK